MIRTRLAIFLTALILPFTAVSQGTFPDRPIKLIVPFAPGGVTDTSGRVIAEALSRRLGQQVVVENKAGASGNIGTQSVVNAAPDGYTLVLGFDGTLVINPHIFVPFPFDPLKDLAPVGKIGDATLILVAHPALPAGNLQELIAHSKKEANGVSYGTSGVGGTPHIAGELLNQQTGSRLVHVPYKGGGQAMSDAIGGNIPLVYTAVAGAHQYVKTGKLKAIAVSSGQRSSALPDVPTFIESGVPGFDVSSWVGILAPAQAPRPIVERLNRELNAVLATPEIVEKLAALGIAATPGSPEAFGTQMKADLVKYGKVVKEAAIKMQ